MKAWYFSNHDCRLRYDDGREIKPGITHTVDCKPVLCEAGLHGSVLPLDALTYAPGPWLWRVELSGDIVRGDDKCAATERTYLWGYDATKVLRHFARLCALDVIHLWDAPEVVVQFLKTGDESLRGAAWATARATARAAAWDAAWVAARLASRVAARDAAWAAARSAARDAAWDAARYEAGEKQNARLYRMLMAGRP